MAFIANASNFTLRDGTFNNIQGDLVIYQGVKRRRVESEDASSPSGLWEPSQKRRREEGQDGLKIVCNEHLNLTLEIGGGSGYLLHAGEIKGRAVIVKVFDSGSSAREHLEATVLHSKGLMHPNVLRIRGISSPTSLNHFIAYENAYWKTAEGPLAAALQEDLDRSIVLGFKLVAGLSAGINYLSVQNISLPLRAENFDVFLDMNDRFLFSIDPPPNAVTENRQRQDGLTSAWKLFNALCQKVLRSANRVLHDEDIERAPITFDSSSRSTRILQPSREQVVMQTDEDRAGLGGIKEQASPVPPRREYVWRTEDVPQPLASVATQINRDIDVRRASIRRLAWNDGRSIHRCPGYIREEITLATRTADSVVVSHDAPTPLEVCSICHEVVHPGEVFRCVCGDPNPGLRHTFKCLSCKFWSHSDCVPNMSESRCQLCVSHWNTGAGHDPVSPRIPFIHPQRDEQLSPMMPEPPAPLPAPPLPTAHAREMRALALRVDTTPRRPVSWLEEGPWAVDRTCESPEPMWRCEGTPCRNPDHKHDMEDMEEKAYVISLASCEDLQLSWEDTDGGSMTRELVRILERDPHPTLRTLLTSASHAMHRMSIERHLETRRYKRELKNYEAYLERLHKAGRYPPLPQPQPPATDDDGDSALTVADPPPPVTAKAKSGSFLDTIEAAVYDMDNFQHPQISSHKPLHMEAPWTP